MPTGTGSCARAAALPANTAEPADKGPAVSVAAAPDFIATLARGAVAAPDYAPNLRQGEFASAPPAAQDPAKLMFTEGRKLLAAQGIDGAKAGKMLGAWRRDFGDAALIAAIGAAVREGAEDPTEFIVACLRRTDGKRPHHRLSNHDALAAGAELQKIE